MGTSRGAVLAGCVGIALASLSGAQGPFVPCDRCPELVEVPPGRYVMGAPESESEGRRFGWGGPPVEVHIAAPFAIGTTEVTRAQWREFVQATGHDATPCVSIWQALVGTSPQPDWQDPRFPGGAAQGDDHPVVCVNWHDAQAYVAWLNRGSREYEFFLPSEAQWEYAARAGATGRTPWVGASTAACAVANVGDRRYRDAVGRKEFIDCDDGYAFTAPVKAYAPNAFGLYGVLGNAWEWTADCWHPDHSRNARDGSAVPPAPDGTCERRTMRGAGFPSADWYARFTTRGGDPPATRFPVIGFRVAARRREAPAP
jgi:formylglycine-generating enzyme required for sulfatase activity